MTRAFARSTLPVLVGSAAFVAVGIAVNDGFESVARSVPGFVLTAAGLVGVTSAIADYPLDRLRRSTRRWWLLAVASFLPYGLTTAPADRTASTVGDALAVSPLPVLFEAVAGAAFLCAVAVSVVFGFATYGIHPGRPTPEDRVLGDDS